MSNNQQLPPALVKFHDSPDYDRVMRLETMAYILHSIANQMREEADSITDKYGFMCHDLRMFSNRCLKAFQLYNGAVKTMLIKDRELQYEFCDDYDKVRKELYRFAGLSDDHNSAYIDEIEMMNNAEKGGEQ